MPSGWPYQANCVLFIYKQFGLFASAVRQSPLQAVASPVYCDVNVVMKNTSPTASQTGGARAVPKEASASKLRLRAWLHLLFAVQDIERQLRQKLADEFDETLARLDVLAALSRVRDGVTMTELSGLLRLTKGNITGLVGRLVRDGLVTRQARDGRSVVVDLSPKGRALFAKMAVAHEQWLDRFLGSLSPGDLRALVDVLAKLRGSL